MGQLLKEGTLKDIVAIPTSVRTKEQAEGLGIPLTTLGTLRSRYSDLDVAIDGADAVDPGLNLVKGGGGALFREKIVEICAKKFIVIVDESKIHEGLGPEVPAACRDVQFCHEHTMRTIANLPSLKGCEAKLRMGPAATGFQGRWRRARHHRQWQLHRGSLLHRAGTRAHASSSHPPPSACYAHSTSPAPPQPHICEPQSLSPCRPRS